MKRFLVLLGVVCVLGGLSLGQSSITVTIFVDNPGQHIPTQELIEQWASENGVTVNIMPITNKTRVPVLTTALEGGTGPVLLILKDFEPALFGEGLIDVSDLADEFGAQNGGWYPICEEIGMVGGSWKALPIYAYAHVMFYRRDVLQQLGLDVPETWEDFRSVLQSIKEAGTMYPFGIAYGRATDCQQWLVGVIRSFGGKILDETGTKIAFNSPETVEALKFVTDLYRDGLLDPTVLGWDDGTNNQAMLASRIAFTFNSFSIKMQAEKDFPELAPNIGAAVYPAGPAGRWIFPSTLSYGIRANASEEEINLAKDLLRWLFKPENYAYVLNYTYGASGTAFKGFADLDIWNRQDWDVNLKAMPHVHVWVTPSQAAAAAWNDWVFVDMISDVLVKAMTPEAAVERAANRLAEYYQLPVE